MQGSGPKHGKSYLARASVDGLDTCQTMSLLLWMANAVSIDAFVQSTVRFLVAVHATEWSLALEMLAAKAGRYRFNRYEVAIDPEFVAQMRACPSRSSIDDPLTGCHIMLCQRINGWRSNRGEVPIKKIRW